MEHLRAAELIQQLKETKERNEITYPRIMDRIEKNGKDVPTPPDSPYSKEIDGLKAVIHVQNEEIARLHEIKEHLESRITFLLEQIEKKDRRMDEKDEIIKKLMERIL